MSDIALIGPKGLVSVFALVGIDVFGVELGKSSSTLSELCKNDNYSIILITESVAKGNLELITTVNLEGRRYIMVIPDHAKQRDMSKLIINKSVEKAIGVDILKE